METDKMLKLMEADKTIKLLRLRNHLTRVIAENNRYLAIRPLESVKEYNQRLTKELEELTKELEILTKLIKEVIE